MGHIQNENLLLRNKIIQKEHTDNQAPSITKKQSTNKKINPIKTLNSNPTSKNSDQAIRTNKYHSDIFVRYA
jgi:hypothetical protein